MGWAVGWDTEHNRWRGYGVPAYCDAKGCMVEIDRGLGYVCACETCSSDDDQLDLATFVCGLHTCADVDGERPEHPDWIAHVTSDESWSQWREDNPEALARLVATTEG